MFRRELMTVTAGAALAAVTTTARANRANEVIVSPQLSKDDQLAWKIARVAADPVAVDADVTDMIVNRVIDSAAIAIAAINTDAVCAARAQALGHPRSSGATVLGCSPDTRVHAEWAAWANSTAVRQLDWGDAFGRAEFAHPSDNISPLIAVAQQSGRSGVALVRAIATGYEIQLDLASGINLHSHGIDHVEHLGPSVAAGIGTMLDLDVEVIYQAVQQAVLVSILTRQIRNGEITSWKANAPAHVGKLAIEGVDRSMRGQRSPTPIYEGAEGLLAVLLGGKDAKVSVPLPAQGEPKRTLLQSFPKQWPAEGEIQPFIDLALKMRGKIGNLANVEKVLIRGSNHLDTVNGNGAHDPRKLDPDASHETLDHSVMYVVAVVLEDGELDHVKSYTPERAHRPGTVALWHKISTVEDPEWTKRYHATDPSKQEGGGRMEITMKDGTVIADEIANANAFNYGATPWKRDDYVQKFTKLTTGILEEAEMARFLETVQRLPKLQAAELSGLNLTLPNGKLDGSKRGLF